MAWSGVGRSGSACGVAYGGKVGGGGVAGANEALEVGQTWHMCGSLGGKGEGGSKRRGSCFQGMLEGGYAGGAYI